jgi:DNA-binding beta-propeller fold protein YncE
LVASSVVTGLSSPYSIVLEGNELYVAEYGSNEISKVDISAATLRALDVVTGLSGPVDIVFHGTDLYVAEYSDNKISKTDMTATVPAAVDVVTGLSGPQGLAIIGYDLYIAEYSADKVVKIAITAVSVDENILSELQFYPNPTSDQVTIQTDEVVESVVIYSVSAQEVAVFNSNEFNIENMANGVYTLKVTADSKTGVQRLIKQ